MFFFKIFFFFLKPLKNFSVKFLACFYAAAAFFGGWRLFPDLACISIVSTMRRSQLDFHWQFLFGDMKTAKRARWRWRPPICERVNELVNLRGLRQTKWRLSGTDGDVLHLRLASCGHLTEAQGVTAKARGGGGGQCLLVFSRHSASPHSNCASKPFARNLTDELTKANR